MAKNTGYLPYPLGARREDDGVTFSFVSGKRDCGILLYDRESGRQKKKLIFSPEERAARKIISAFSVSPLTA